MTPQQAGRAVLRAIILGLPSIQCCTDSNYNFEMVQTGGSGLNLRYTMFAVLGQAARSWAMRATEAPEANWSEHQERKLSWCDRWRSRRAWPMVTCVS